MWDSLVSVNKTILPCFRFQDLWIYFWFIFKIKNSIYKMNLKTFFQLKSAQTPFSEHNFWTEYFQMIINLSKTTLMTQFWPASAVGLISMWIHMGCNIEARQQLECIVQQIFSCHSLDFLLTQNLWRLSDLLSKTHSVKLVWIVLTSSYTNPCSPMIESFNTVSHSPYQIWTYHQCKNLS